MFFGLPFLLMYEDIEAFVDLSSMCSKKKNELHLETTFLITISKENFLRKIRSNYLY